jgi:PAS domain S-box-containing protein
MEVALSTIIDAITWTDEQGKVKWSNATFDNLVGQHRFQVLGANLCDLLPLTQQGQVVPIDAHPVTLALENQSNDTRIYEFQGVDKSLILEISWAYIQFKGTNASAVLAIRDISERQKAEEELKRHREHLKELVEERTAELVAANEQIKQAQVQLVQTEKMSSLGRLVAGIAHEINNPVNFIYGNLIYINEYTQGLLKILSLYQECVPEPPAKIREQIEEIDLDFLVKDLPKTISSLQMGAERIRQIVLSLRTFSRLDEAEVKKVDLHEGIESTLLILEYRLKAHANTPGIQILRKYGDLPLVDCYAGQINQVFMNILSNAIDSLESPCENDGLVSHNGDVYNGCSCSTCANPSTITIYTEVIDPNWVAIRIADNGPGMSETVRNQLFDPFFTTKPIGKGTGLGLSISYQIIVEKHKGTLECVSEPGKGAEFVIKIPVDPSELQQ